MWCFTFLCSLNLISLVFSWFWGSGPVSSHRGPVSSHRGPTLGCDFANPQFCSCSGPPMSWRFNFVEPSGPADGRPSARRLVFPRTPKIIPKWRQNDPWGNPKSFQNQIKIIPNESKSYQNDAKMMVKWCPNDAQVIPNWFQNYTKMLSETF